MITCQKKFSHWPGSVCLVSAGLRVTAGYPQMKKDSVAAVFIQLYADYPNSIGSVQRLPDDIGLVPVIQTANGVQDFNHRKNVHSVGDLALRFSDLSFLSQASITQEEKFEFSPESLSASTQASISPINSCGNLIPLVVDLLFLYPVAINEFLIEKCRNTIPEKFQIKTLDVFMHLTIWCLYTLICESMIKTTPRSATNTIEASDHNVNWSNSMAMYSLPKLTLNLYGVLLNVRKIKPPITTSPHIQRMKPVRCFPVCCWSSQLVSVRG